MWLSQVLFIDRNSCAVIRPLGESVLNARRDQWATQALTEKGWSATCSVWIAGIVNSVWKERWIRKAKNTVVKLEWVQKINKQFLVFVYIANVFCFSFPYILYKTTFLGEWDFLGSYIGPCLAVTAGTAGQWALSTTGRVSVWWDPFSLAQGMFCNPVQLLFFLLTHFLN